MTLALGDASPLCAETQGGKLHRLCRGTKPDQPDGGKDGSLAWVSRSMSISQIATKGKFRIFMKFPWK